MYELVRLCRDNFKYLKILNDSRNSFNILNEDFVKVYSKSNFFKKILLRKDVYILFRNKVPKAYIWLSGKNYNYTIHALNIIKDEYYENYMLCIKKCLKKGCNYTYYCHDNEENIQLLESVGFYKYGGTIEMNLNLLNDFNLSVDGIHFKVLEKGKEEPIRCKIQNEVFKNKCRIPLKIGDIYFDEKQSYYFDNGSILLKKDNDYVGYGQIIIQNNIPVIVNVGILKEFRGLGYGEALIKHLLQIIKHHNFTNALINVDYKNKVALNLYKKCGFKIANTHYIMKLVN